MKDKLIEATKANLKSKIEYHRMNVEIMLQNPMSIHEHVDLMGSIQDELGKISEYQDKLKVLKKFF